MALRKTRRMTARKTTKRDQQWPDCSDKERVKVPGINLAIRDMTNPCKLAKQYRVKLGQLRAFTVRDSATTTGERLNDFVIARKLTASVKVRSAG
jgi:hypothetical protein